MHCTNCETKFELKDGQYGRKWCDGCLKDLQIAERLFDDAPVKNEHAGGLMITAIIQEWLQSRDWPLHDAFEFSFETYRMMRGLEDTGYLVILRGETRCSNCGVCWPKGHGFDITYCSACREIFKEHAPDEYPLEEPATGKGS